MLWYTVCWNAASSRVCNEGIVCEEALRFVHFMLRYRHNGLVLITVLTIKDTVPLMEFGEIIIIIVLFI